MLLTFSDPNEASTLGDRLPQPSSPKPDTLLAVSSFMMKLGSGGMILSSPKSHHLFAETSRFLHFRFLAAIADQLLKNMGASGVELNAETLRYLETGEKQ